MPRIPVRTEPYTSPSRQHRHYKNKRDQVLRSLGKAAYINGSHFAIMWVSARGDVETYASEALQGRLDDWFGKQGVADEAKELVRQYRNSSSHSHSISQPIFFDGDDDGLDGIDDDMKIDESLSDDGQNFDEGSRPATTASSSTRTPMLPNSTSDVFTDDNDARPKLQRSATTYANGTSSRARRPIAPLDTNAANSQYYRGNATLGLNTPRTGMPNDLAFRSAFGYNDANEGSELTNTSVLYPTPGRTSDEHGLHGASTAALGRLPTNSSMNAGSSLFETTFTSQAARTAFLELRFSQLQQGMCKTVAKAWIKIIEPKKQTRCPYNKGEEGKPDWWPEGVRHKEPDHLMKPERHALLLTILRSPRVRVARLQLATAEVVALIKADKVSLLMDVYRVAREEEKMREAGIDQDNATTVAISTMEGWSEDGQCAIDVDRPNSPGAANAADVDEENADRKGKKRSGGPLTRSVSASNAQRRDKRRSVDGQGKSAKLFENHTFIPADSSNPALLAHQAPSSAVHKRSGAQAQTWLLHEPTQYGVKRTSISSHTLSSTIPHRQLAPNGHANSQQALHEQYGLITPLTANTQLMDPSFLAAVKSSSSFGGAELRSDGYMSAPAGHMQLHPHELPFNHASDLGPQQHSQQGNALTSNQQPYYYDLQTPSGQYHSSAVPELNQTNLSNIGRPQTSAQDPFAYAGQPSDTTVNSGGALGLQGIGINWNQASGFPSGFNNADVANAMGWWNNPTTSKNGAMASNSLNEPPFDNSFASTIDSGGPSTPPPAPHANLSEGEKGSQSWNDNVKNPPALLGSADSANRQATKGLDSESLRAHITRAPPNSTFENWMFANQSQGHSQ